MFSRKSRYWLASASNAKYVCLRFKKCVTWEVAAKAAECEGLRLSGMLHGRPEGEYRILEC